MMIFKGERKEKTLLKSFCSEMLLSVENIFMFFRRYFLFDSALKKYTKNWGGTQFEHLVRARLTPYRKRKIVLFWKNSRGFRRQVDINIIWDRYTFDKEILRGWFVTLFFLFTFNSQYHSLILKERREKNWRLCIKVMLRTAFRRAPAWFFTELS